MNENSFEILLNIDISNINEFSLELNRKEEDLKLIVEGLCLIIRNRIIFF